MKLSKLHYKIILTKLLLSSGQLNLNYKDAEGNSVLMNILQSQNTPLLKNYFSKAKVETDFKLFPLIPNNSGHTIYEIAAVAENKKISKILYHKIVSLSNKKGPVNYVKNGPLYLKFFMSYYLQIYSY